MTATELYIRTEEIEPEDILKYLVRTPTDQDIIEHLKGRSPIILKGSRGSGKSFLLRSAQAEMLAERDKRKVLPVYVTFMNSTVVRVGVGGHFIPWMIAATANEIIRAAHDLGLSIPKTAALNAIGGSSDADAPSPLERIQAEYEESWRRSGGAPDSSAVPDVSVLVNAARDLCREAGLRRINLLVDEAAQVFLPEQQRHFFTLMRDLRSPYISVKAAVYPGATSFGYSFQPGHDASVVSIDRNITDRNYLSAMREIVSKQDDRLRKVIMANGENFDTLAYAATGNPRVLLTTLRDAMPLRRANCENVLKTYYRDAIWKEHNDLAARYPGHRKIIDWGANFVRNHVFEALGQRHYRKPGALFDLWAHRDAPRLVHEALQLLCYSGVLQEAAQAVKRRDGIGTRYIVNLGCQFTISKDPMQYALEARADLGGRDVIEFGRNHRAYESLDLFSDGDILQGNTVLEARLKAPSTVLKLSQFQQDKIRELNLKTISDVLAADEATFRKARGVREVRARQIHNAAVAAVLEYLSG